MHGADTAWPGGVDLQLCFPAHHGLGVTWTRVEDHSPEPPGLGPVAPLFDQDGEVARGEVAVDALVDATELVGTLESQDPPPAGFGLGRLARLAMQDRLAEMQLVGSSGSIRSPRNTPPRAAGRRRLTSPGH